MPSDQQPRRDVKDLPVGKFTTRIGPQSIWEEIINNETNVREHEARKLEEKSRLRKPRTRIEIPAFGPPRQTKPGEVEELFPPGVPFDIPTIEDQEALRRIAEIQKLWAMKPFDLPREYVPGFPGTPFLDREKLKREEMPAPPEHGPGDDIPFNKDKWRKGVEKQFEEKQFEPDDPYQSAEQARVDFLNRTFPVDDRVQSFRDMDKALAAKAKMQGVTGKYLPPPTESPLKRALSKYQRPETLSSFKGYDTTEAVRSAPPPPPVELPYTQPAMRTGRYLTDDRSGPQFPMSQGPAITPASGGPPFTVRRSDKQNIADQGAEPYMPLWKSQLLRARPGG